MGNFESQPTQTPFAGPPPSGISFAWLRWFSRIAEVLSAVLGSFTTYTPVVTAGSGAFTTVSAKGRYKKIGPLVFIQMAITITTNGTAAIEVDASLPFPSLNVAGVVYQLAGRAQLVSRKMLQGVVNANSGLAGIVNYDNTYPGADGETLIVSGVYEANG